MAIPNFYLVFVNGIAGREIYESAMEGGENTDIATFLEQQLPNAQKIVFNTIARLGDSETLEKSPSFHQRALELLELLQHLDQKQTPAAAAEGGNSEKNKKDDMTASDVRIIFAGHDIGGCVIKQALLISESAEHCFQWVAERTTAVLFFDTPHSALGVPGWEEVIVHILASARKKVNILSFMQCLPPYAAQLEESFAGLWGNYHMINFHSKSALSTVGYNGAQKVHACDKSVALECRIDEMWTQGAAGNPEVAIANVISAHRDTYSCNSQDYSRLCLQALAEIDLEPHSLRTSVDGSMPSTVNNWVEGMDWYLDWLRNEKSDDIRENKDNFKRQKDQKNKRSDVLHIFGPPGCGTTLLVCKILRLLKVNDHRVLSYAVGKRSPDDVSRKGLFCSLCQQALLAFPNANYASRLCDWVLKEGLFSSEAFRGLLCSLLSSVSDEPVFCIIHGTSRLSSSSQEMIRQDLEIVRSHAQRPFKLLLTGESLGQWEKMRPPYNAVNLHETQIQQAEMQRLAETRLEALVQRRPVWGPVTRDLKVAEKISSESETIFEVARKLDFLESHDIAETKEAVERLVAKLPVSLDDLHKTVIDRLPQDCGMGFSAIPWILHSLRALSPAELAVCSALCRSPNDKTSLESLRQNISWNPAADLHRSLGAICCVIGEKVHVRHRMYSGLLSTKVTDRTPRDIHLHLLTMCLEYLKLVFGHGSGNEDSCSACKQANEFCFLGYATLHWPDHCLKSENKDQAASKVLKFLEDPGTFNAWSQTFTIHSAKCYRNPTIMSSPLEAASYFGLKEVVDHLIEALDLSQEPAIQSVQTAMGFAAERGHAGVVESLAMKTTVTQDAMRNAAIGGHVACVSALIDAGTASLNHHESESEYSPFLEAVRHGHTAVASKLMAVSTDCNEVSKTLNLSALHLASRIGHADIVQELLNSGVSLTLVDTSGYDALKYAAEGGFHVVVDKLLENSCRVTSQDTHAGDRTSDSPLIEINSQETSGNTALHLASANGHSAVVESLIDKKANVWVENKDNHTPLHIACKKGLLGIVNQLLMATSEQPIGKENKFSGPSDSPIELAVQEQHLHIVKALLASNQAFTRPSTLKALALACKEGYLDCAKELIQWNLASPDHREKVFSGIDTEGNTMLHIAASFNRLEIMKHIFNEKNIPFDSTNYAMETPLHMAAKAGHVQACRELLFEGAPDKVFANDDTPIHLAAKNGHVNVVTELLKHNPAVADGPLLHAAVENGSHAMTGRILDANSEDNPFLNWTNDDGDTAVHIAIQYRHSSLISILGKAGAAMGVRNDSGETPFFLAAEAQMLDAVKALFDTNSDIKADEPNNEGISPLMTVCMETDNVEIVEQILSRCDKAELEVNRRDPDNGRTALHFSADEDKSYRMTELLLDHGADPNIKNNRGSTPMYLASEVGDVQKLKKLLDSGGNTNVTNKSNSTPLHRASQNGHVECITILVENGSDINHESDYGYTPLGLAAARQHLGAVDELIRLGADVTIAIHAAAKKQNETATRELWRRCDQETIRRLNNTGGKGGSLLAAAVAQQDTEMVKLFLENEGLDINVADESGRSPLIIAIMMNDDELIKLLLEKGARTNITDREGRTPLIRAIVQESVEMTELLLNSDEIDIAQLDSRNHTALYWAARSSDSRSSLFETVLAATRERSGERISIFNDAIHGAVSSANNSALEALLGVPGIDTNVPDADGWTPLRTAECCGHSKMMDMLIAHGALTEQDAKAPINPTGWHLIDKSRALHVLPDSPTIVDVAGEISENDESLWAVARADHCMPGDRIYYFEVKIEKGFEYSDTLGIGFCQDNTPLDQMLGVNSPSSWGYHADDGCYFPSRYRTGDGKEYEYETGDVVGCGVDFHNKTAFFTLNGEHLGDAFTGITGRLYPAIFTDMRKGVRLVANFENTPKNRWMYDPESPKKFDSGSSNDSTASSDHFSDKEEDD